MMHRHVMNKISLRGMAKKRANEPHDPVVDPHVSFFEKFAVTDTMQHQTETPFKV